MKFEKAIDFLLKGQRIRNTKWSADDAAYNILDSFAEFCSNLRDWDNWEVPVKTVPFYEAWGAYEEGKQIRSVQTGFVFSKGQEAGLVYKRFGRDEIRGEWEIL